MDEAEKFLQEIMPSGWDKFIVDWDIDCKNTKFQISWPSPVSYLCLFDAFFLYIPPNDAAQSPAQEPVVGPPPPMALHPKPALPGR